MKRDKEKREERLALKEERRAVHKRKKDEKAMKKAQHKIEEDRRKRAQTEIARKQNRLSRVLGDAKDLYEVITESEDDLRKKRKEAERLQREMEEQEQDEAASVYEFLGSGSDGENSDSEVLIFSEEGEAVMCVPVTTSSSANSVPDMEDGSAGEHIVGEENGTQPQSDGNTNGIAITVEDAGAGSGSDAEDGIVFYTEEGENVKVESVKQKKKAEGGNVPGSPKNGRGQSKKEIDMYMKKQNEAAKKKSGRDKDSPGKDKGKTKKNLKNSSSGLNNKGKKHWF